MCGPSFKGKLQLEDINTFSKKVGPNQRVVEARDPHDSPEVDAIRQKLLEDYAGSVYQDRTGGNPHPRIPWGGRGHIKGG